MNQIIFKPQRKNDRGRIKPGKFIIRGGIYPELVIYYKKYQVHTPCYYSLSKDSFIYNSRHNELNINGKEIFQLEELIERLK